MIKIFIHPTKVPTPLFIVFESSGSKNNRKLFQNVLIENTHLLYEVVNDPLHADIIAIPHNYFSIQNNKAYLNEVVSLSRQYNKHILVFAYGDSSQKIQIPNSIVVRTSQYRSKKEDNEILMPAYVEDLGAGGVTFIKEKNAIPKVGFVGWADFANMIDRCKYYLKLLNIAIQIVFGLEKKTQFQGLFFRRCAMHILSRSSLVKSHFIIRRSYSGHVKAIETSPERVRKEFIDVINDSDVALAVKGDGNYSLRFFEILSLGRIPVLIDTDCPLPLEDELRYSDFILKIGYSDIYDIDKIIADFYERHTRDQLLDMQKKARLAFEQSLSINAFLKILFKKLDDLYGTR